MRKSFLSRIFQMANPFCDPTFIRFGSIYIARNGNSGGSVKFGNIRSEFSNVIEILFVANPVLRWFVCSVSSSDYSIFARGEIFADSSGYGIFSRNWIGWSNNKGNLNAFDGKWQNKRPGDFAIQWYHCHSWRGTSITQAEYQLTRFPRSSKMQQNAM